MNEFHHEEADEQKYLLVVDRRQVNRLCPCVPNTMGGSSQTWSMAIMIVGIHGTRLLNMI